MQDEKREVKYEDLIEKYWFMFQLSQILEESGIYEARRIKIIDKILNYSLTKEQMKILLTSRYGITGGCNNARGNH